MITIKKTKLFRMIIPAFPYAGIFNRFHKKITALGAVVIATVVNQFLSGWRAEVIDENNYIGPRTLEGKVDHTALQQQTPAGAVGIYCGLSSPMPRAWEIAQIYKNFGIPTIAGGRHVSFIPQESIENGFDIVVVGEGENAILEILQNIQNDKKPTGIIKGVAPDLEAIPFPDFGLLRFAKKIKIYPISRIRGCKMKCEFCSVNEAPRWYSADHLFAQVCWLVETRKAKSFFIADDRLEEDRDGYMEFFQLIKNLFGKKLRFTAQVRLAAAEDTELLIAMKEAGVTVVCIGFESPIDTELKAMHKGTTVAKMLAHTKMWVKNFSVHGMFIFGYPLPPGVELIDFRTRIRLFKKFIKNSRIDTIQIMHPIPLIGSKLRDRLEKANQLFPLGQVGWDRYSGEFACYRPNDMTLEQLQKGPTQIMKWFYSWHAWYRVPFRTLTMPLLYLISGWPRWHRGWFNDVVKIGANILLRKQVKEEQKYIRSLM